MPNQPYSSNSPLGLDVTMAAVLASLNSWDATHHLKRDQRDRTGVLQDLLNINRNGGAIANIDLLNKDCTSYELYWTPKCGVEAVSCDEEGFPVTTDPCQSRQGVYAQDTKIKVNADFCPIKLKEARRINLAKYCNTPIAPIDHFRNQVEAAELALKEKITQWTFKRDLGLASVSDTSRLKLRNLRPGMVNGKAAYALNPTMMNSSDLFYDFIKLKRERQMEEACAFDSCVFDRMYFDAQCDAENPNGQKPLARFERTFSADKYIWDEQDILRPIFEKECGTEGGMLIMDKGARAVTFSHCYNVIDNASFDGDIETIIRRVTGDTVTVNSVADRFGALGGITEIKDKHKYAFSKLLPGVTQFLHVPGVGIRPFPVYYDMHITIHCCSEKRAGKEMIFPCMDFEPVAYIQYNAAPTSCRPDDTGAALILPDCGVMPLGPCDQPRPKCDDFPALGFNLTNVGGVITISSEQPFMNANGTPLSSFEHMGQQIEGTVLDYSIGLYGNTYADVNALIEMITSEQMTADYVKSLCDGCYTFKGEVTIEYTVDGQTFTCVKPVVYSFVQECDPLPPIETKPVITDGTLTFTHTLFGLDASAVLVGCTGTATDGTTTIDISASTDLTGLVGEVTVVGECTFTVQGQEVVIPLEACFPIVNPTVDAVQKKTPASNRKKK